MAEAIAAYNNQCTAIGNLDHCLNQDCDTITIRLKGDSDGKAKKIHLPI